MTNTNKTFSNKPISYEIGENEYTIYLGGVAWIKQYGEYSKPIDITKSLEENCLLQIEELTAEVPIEEVGEENE